MPATKLTRALFNPARQQKELCTVIRICMARKGIRTQNELGTLLHLAPSQISKRMHSGGWSAEELWRLIFVLEPTPEELLRMVACYRAA